MAGLGDILGNVAKVAGLAAIDASIGSSNRKAIGSTASQILGSKSRGGEGGGQKKAPTQSSTPNFNSVGGGLPPNASLLQILQDTSRVDRETLQAVRLQTAKMDEINDTLDGIKYGVENLEKQITRNEDRKAARARAAMSGSGGKGGAGSSGGGLLDLLLEGGEGILGALGLKKVLSSSKPKTPKTGEPEARSRLVEPEVADKALAETAEKGAAETTGKVGAEAATKLGSEALGKTIPILGDILMGYLQYRESGSVGEGISAGLGSLAGRIGGGFVGTAAGPVGTVAGEIGGSIAGAEGGAALYRLMSGTGQVVDKSKIVDADSLVISARDMVFEAEKFDIKSLQGLTDNQSGVYGGTATDDYSSIVRTAASGVGGVGSGRALGGQDTVSGDIVASGSPSPAIGALQSTSGGEGGVGSGRMVGGQDTVAGDTTTSNSKLDGVTPAAKDLFNKVSSSFGGAISISSGLRDEGSNARAGGAKNSAHLRGNALDAHFAADIPSTLKFIKIASESGAGGIGVYKPGSVHIDVEGRRGWGPSYHKDSIPSWAKDIMDAHMSGTMSSYQLSGTGSKTGSDISSMSKNVAAAADSSSTVVVTDQPRGGGASTDMSSTGPSIQAGVVPEARPPVNYWEIYDMHPHETDRR